MTDSGSQATPCSEMLTRLCGRLDEATDLALDVRRAMVHGDALTIETAAARLETLAVELKLVTDEYQRLPAEQKTGAQLEAARAALERSATRLARQAAVGGGLLERLVYMTARLLGSLQTAGGELYLPTGRPGELRAHGVQLTEKA